MDKNKKPKRNGRYKNFQITADIHHNFIEPFLTPEWGYKTSASVVVDALRRFKIQKRKEEWGIIKSPGGKYHE